MRKEQTKFKNGLNIPLEPIAGTRDFLPQSMGKREWLFDKFKLASKLHGFAQYDTPILEADVLYKRKGGEEILSQMYNFTDKSGNQVALRPEGTPSLTRLIMKNGRTMKMPIKWFSIPQCWRYETITKGRKREHYQWNCDIWGVPSATAEVELISCLVSFFKSVGLTDSDVRIKFSSRNVLRSALPEGANFEEECVLADKSGARELAGMPMDESLRPFVELCEQYGISSWLEFNPTIVRGLSYYTGLVFEAFSPKHNRAICGGGRYDNITKIYGGKTSIPACGFGMGDCVIMDLIDIPCQTISPKYLVIPFSEDYRERAIMVLNALRGKGESVDIYMKKFKKLPYGYADFHNIENVVLVAPSEWPNVKVKDMKTGTEKIINPF